MVLFTVVTNTARRATDAAGASAFYPHAQRAHFTPDLLRKVRDEATTGLTDEYQYSKLSLTFGEEKTGSSNVQDAHELAKTQKKALNHCRKFDMAEIFTEFPRINFSNPTNPTYDPNIDGTLNLFEAFDTITIEHVAKSIEFLRTYSPDTLFDRIKVDLKWSAQFFLESCSVKQQLRDEVHDAYAAIVDVNSLAAGGPLVLRVLLDKITSSDATVLDALASSFKSTKISDITGENVELLCKQLLCFLERLEMTGKLPNLLEISLCDVFQTSSTDAFNASFQRKKEALFESSTAFTWRDLLESATTIYTRMNLVQEWNTTSGSDSFFQAGTDRRNNQKGNHRDTRDRDAPPKDPRFRHPDPRTDTKLSDDPRRWKTSLDGQEVHWCAKCNQGKGRWTDGSHRHFTDEHKGRRSNADSPPHANAANASSTSSTSSADHADDSSFTATLARFNTNNGSSY